MDDGTGVGNMWWGLDVGSRWRWPLLFSQGAGKMSIGVIELVIIVLVVALLVVAVVAGFYFWQQRER